MKDLKEEIKDSISTFCEENDQYEPKAIKNGYKFFKKLTNDHQEAVSEEFMRDKIVELLIGVQ